MHAKLIALVTLMSICLVVSQAAFASPHSNRTLNPQPLPPVSAPIDFNI